jgi:hypothetical protein
MADISLEFDQAQLAAVQMELRDLPKGLSRAMSQSINDTTKQVRGQMASDLTKSIAMKRGDVVQLISRTNAKPTLLAANVHMRESERVPLARFGARQTASGVSYKIKKKGGRSRIASAFGPNIAKLNKQVFRRTDKSRLPLTKLFGPSPAVAFIGEGLEKKTEVDASAMLSKNLNRRVRFLLLKKAGVI